MTKITINQKVLDEVDNKIHNPKKYIYDYIKRNGKNDNIDAVVAKILLIDFDHNTQLSSHYGEGIEIIAKHIVSNHKSIDVKISKGDISVISDFDIPNKASIYSFATKYCQIHNDIVYNRDDFYKNDSVVRQNIFRYIDAKNIPADDKGKNKGIKINETAFTRSYKYYIDVLDAILRQNHLDPNKHNNRRKLDHFIWALHRTNPLFKYNNLTFEATFI